MSTNHTTNYDLNQWEGTDKVLRTEFNADNAKIDAALKANADAIAAKADQSALESLGAQITQTQASQLRVATGSYTGKGKRAANIPTASPFRSRHRSCSSPKTRTSRTSP